jgi:hypothetical protein
MRWRAWAAQSIVGESRKTSEPKTFTGLEKIEKQLGEKNYNVRLILEFFSMEN